MTRFRSQWKKAARGALVLVKCPALSLPVRRDMSNRTQAEYLILGSVLLLLISMTFITPSRLNMLLLAAGAVVITAYVGVVQWLENH